MAPDPYRLPRSVIPRRYDIELAPDLGGARFSGRVRVELEVAERVDRVVLNAAELDVESCTLDGVPVSFTLDEGLERLEILPSTSLAAGSAVLEVVFTGTLNDRLRGFYRSTYVDDRGIERVIAPTQMQSTDCRRAFPCWDEPDFKAIFGISLKVEEGLVAISNAPEHSSTTLADGRRLVRFEDTMVMSTYLVAMVVGPLAVTDPVDVDGTPIRIVHIPGKESLTGFGMDAAVAGLRFFERFYGIPYPGRKIDLVALPDFAAGAMENLGCITFRESLLLIDPNTSTQVEQQRVVDVITHELAHMWFGDLVTMRWWNGIWLNEAFATFMEVDATDTYRPDWKRWTNFALERAAAFEVDSLASTRAVEFEVRSPQDAEGMFDVLTYQKGGALLRMLQQYLGPERFRDGIRRYLDLHSYSNTETSDLWDAIEATTGDPVRRIMDSWIWQPGFPLITASLEGGELVLTQSRFGYTETAQSDPTMWLVPVRVSEVQAGNSTTVLLEGRSTRLPLAGPSAVIVNSGGHGFFRVAYDRALRERITPDVLDSLETIDRFNLVADAWASVIAGRLAALDFLALAESFGNETDLAVWQAIDAGLRGCDRLVDDSSRPEFARRVRALTAPALGRLGWERTQSEDQLTSQLRGLLVQMLGVRGADPDTIVRCADLFTRGLADPAAVDPEVFAAALAVSAAQARPEHYDACLAAFRAAATPQDAVRFLYALADFDDADLVARTVAFSLTGEVKTQNAPFVIGRAIANRVNGRVAWDLLRQHWADANERFPTNTIVRMVDPVKTLDQDQDVRLAAAFFAENPIPQGAKTLAQILERQAVNAALQSRERLRFSEALQRR